MQATDTPSGRNVIRLDIRSIAPNPAQPRRLFDEGSLESLADSIHLHGLLSPILVRRINIGQYELIAGERRLRALKKLGRTYADALVVTAYDTDSALMALIENIQREQLHFLDEAEACRAILDSEPFTQEELASKLGRSPSALANRLRLLKLTPQVKSLIRNSSLSERHARALLAVNEPSLQLDMARRACDMKLTVRQLEQRIARSLSKPSIRPKCIARDHRLYVNAVIDTVDKLRALGAAADISFSESDSGTEIHILLKKPVHQ